MQQRIRAEQARARARALFLPTETIMGEPAEDTTSNVTRIDTRRRAATGSKAKKPDQVTFRCSPNMRKKLEKIRRAQGFDNISQAARFVLEAF